MFSLELVESRTNNATTLMISYLNDDVTQKIIIIKDLRTT